MKIIGFIFALFAVNAVAQTVTFEDGSTYTLSEGEAVFVLKRLIGEDVVDPVPEESCAAEDKTYDFYDLNKDGSFTFGGVEYCYDPCEGPRTATVCGG